MCTNSDAHIHMYMCCSDEWMKQHKLQQIIHNAQSQQLPNETIHSSNQNLSISNNAQHLNELMRKISIKLQSECKHANAKSINQSQLLAHDKATIKAQIESFVEKELYSQCSVCFEPMINQENEPLLVIPCAHTFCKECVQKLGMYNCWMLHEYLIQHEL